MASAALSRSPMKTEIQAQFKNKQKIEKDKEKTLSNYKEVWTPANCKTSVATTGMYEAGGSLLWLDPGFQGEHVSM